MTMAMDPTQRNEKLVMSRNMEVFSYDRNLYNIYIYIYIMITKDTYGDP